MISSSAPSFTTALLLCLHTDIFQFLIDLSALQASAPFQTRPGELLWRNLVDSCVDEIKVKINKKLHLQGSTFSCDTSSC